MANTNQKRLRKAIHRWAKKGKAEGATQPGYKVKTNPWTRNA